MQASNVLPNDSVSLEQAVGEYRKAFQKMGNLFLWLVLLLRVVVAPRSITRQPLPRWLIVTQLFVRLILRVDWPPAPMKPPRTLFNL